MAKIGSDTRAAIVYDFFEVLGKSGNSAAKFANLNNTSSYQKIRGDMTKHILNSIPQADLNQGSVLNTLLETIAHSQSQFQQDTLRIIRDLTVSPKRGPRACK